MRTSLVNKIDSILEQEIDPAFARRAKIILENIGQGKEILDLGCGRGFYLKTCLKLFPKSNIVGIDKNESYLKVAHRLTKGQKNVKVQKADATNLPFKNNSFDRVIASEILEHINDDEKAVSEIYRILKPKGKAIITVPYKDYPFLWDPLNWVLEKIFKIHIPENIWWLAGIWADHKRLYLEKELAAKIKHYNFRIKQKKLTTHYCLPFSHFLFYGIGKNIVEKGWLKDFNRFEKTKRANSFFKLVKAAIKIPDGLNEKKRLIARKHSFVNLVIVVEKLI